jgi:hypothetical protein
MATLPSSSPRCSRTFPYLYIFPSRFPSRSQELLRLYSCLTTLLQTRIPQSDLSLLALELRPPQPNPRLLVSLNSMLLCLMLNMLESR